MQCVPVAAVSVNLISRHINRIAVYTTGSSSTSQIARYIGEMQNVTAARRLINGRGDKPSAGTTRDCMANIYMGYVDNVSLGLPIDSTRDRN